MESILILAIALCSVQQLAAVPQDEAQILAGSNVDITEVPYQVFFEFNGKPFGGGSIISPTFILTAAHCTVTVENIKKIKVIVGTSYTNSGGISKNVRKISIHKRYDSRTQVYDYCLVELDSPLEFSESVSRVVLPGEHELVKNGESCIVSGWGFSEIVSKTPTDLSAANMTIIDKDMCSKNLSNPFTDQIVCAGSNQRDVGICGGDCGAPLVCRGKLVGIVSRGYLKNCELPQKPTVCASVAAVKGWIRGVTGV